MSMQPVGQDTSRLPVQATPPPLQLLQQLPPAAGAISSSGAGAGATMTTTTMIIMMTGVSIMTATTTMIIMTVGSLPQLPCWPLHNGIASNAAGLLCAAVYSSALQAISSCKSWPQRMGHIPLIDLPHSKPCAFLALVSVCHGS